MILPHSLFDARRYHEQMTDNFIEAYLPCKHILIESFFKHHNLNDSPKKNRLTLL
jgi:hypothetical protein